MLPFVPRGRGARAFFLPPSTLPRNFKEGIWRRGELNGRFCFCRGESIAFARKM